MSKQRIQGEIWFRYIHDTWENSSGYRTDIAQNVLKRTDLRKAVYILDDRRAIVIVMEELRRVLKDTRVRSNGMVGPFNLNPHKGTIDGKIVSMQIEPLKDKP